MVHSKLECNEMHDGFTAEELIKCAEMSIKVGSKIREEIIKQTQNGDN